MPQAHPQPTFSTGPWHLPDVPEADRHLLNAAPDLYRELAMMVLVARESMEEAGRSPLEIAEELACANAALAKARGDGPEVF